MHLRLHTFHNTIKRVGKSKLDYIKRQENIKKSFNPLT